MTGPALEAAALLRHQTAVRPGFDGLTDHLQFLSSAKN
jgi:hypothetical protein